MNLQTELVDSSALQIKSEGTKRLVEICQAVNGTEYLSGQGGKKYMEEQRFEDADIALRYQKFEHPVYQQRFGEFIPNLSILDMIMNIGVEKSKLILRSL